MINHSHNLEGSLYEQNSFVGRLRHFLDVTDMRYVRIMILKQYNKKRNIYKGRFIMSIDLTRKILIGGISL